MTSPILEEIDLSKTTARGGAGLEVGPTYLVLYDGRFYTGTFSMQWYGLNFHGIYTAGAQYDPPPSNYSSWQRIWKITNADELASEAEPSYMERRRRYAIDHRLKDGDVVIDDSAPLEAFGYVRRVSPMGHKKVEGDESEFEVIEDGD